MISPPSGEERLLYMYCLTRLKGAKLLVSAAGLWYPLADAKPDHKEPEWRNAHSSLARDIEYHLRREDLELGGEPEEPGSLPSCCQEGRREKERSVKLHGIPYASCP